ncbi:growth factor [Histomonas meleagridis]|uniref:growth factor n=1 Tax=Histomonas meleagridis TaxID=135588 RepID=UPI00355946B6|nr:growth factor [Histomonas meleagridis]KAH0802232.1 growth factor [Histomonas meleagridis]
MNKVKTTQKKAKISTSFALRKIRAIKAEREAKENPVEPNKKEDFTENELDEIFSNIKKNKKEKAKQQALNAEKLGQPKKRKYTSDGLPIYTEEELGMNNPKAGTTPLCPFDCDCCH